MQTSLPPTEKAENQNKGNLVERVRESVREFDRLKNLNQWLGISIGLFGILLGFGATVSGLFDEAKAAAIFGAGASTTQAILFAYPVDKRASAYRTLSAKARNLLIDLELKNNAPEQLQQLIEELKAIQLEAAAEEGKATSLEDTIARLKMLLAEYDLKNTPKPGARTTNLQSSLSDKA